MKSFTTINYLHDKTIAKDIVYGAEKRQKLEWYGTVNGSLVTAIAENLSSSIPLGAGKVNMVFTFDALKKKYIIKCAHIKDQRSDIFVNNNRIVYNRLAKLLNSKGSKGSKGSKLANVRDVRDVFSVPIAMTGKGGFWIENKKYYFTIEEMIEGKSMKEMMATMTPTEFANALVKINEALQHMAQFGFNHNDMHYENIMIRVEDKSPVIIDYDWACFWDTPSDHKELMTLALDEMLHQMIKMNNKTGLMIQTPQDPYDWHRRRIVYMMGTTSVQSWSAFIDFAMLLESIAYDMFDPNMLAKFQTQPKYIELIHHVWTESRKANHNIDAVVNILTKYMSIGGGMRSSKNNKTKSKSK